MLLFLTTNMAAMTSRANKQYIFSGLSTSCLATFWQLLVFRDRLMIAFFWFSIKNMVFH